ncbi:hypothetical protein [Hyphococcus sp.]|uniref:hypothetical protein n=1 Tax=Hyphococcus sp. TaxID=2038636 RepID=UPI003D0C6E23
MNISQRNPLTAPEARKLWNSYLAALRKHRRGADKKEWRCFEQDIQLHVLEHLAQHNDLSEEQRLRDALEALGSAEEIAAAFIRQAPMGSSSLPAAIAVGVVASSIALLRSLLLILAVTFFAMGAAHLFNKDVGLWLHGGWDWSLSFEKQEGAQQALRGFFSPAAIVLAAMLAGCSFILPRRDGARRL